LTFDLILIGFGNVARRFVTLLAEQRTVLARRYGITTRVVGIATRRHGQAYAAAGWRPEEIASDVVRTFRSARHGRPEGLHDGDFFRASQRGHYVASTTLDFLRTALTKSRAAARQRRLVVIETTTLDIARGEPATSHILTALSGGAHVVTANKGPVAFAYRRLARAAERADRRFLFEGAVMDGIPVFNLVRETLPAVTVTGFRGVVNSTTNFILTAMEQGQPFAAALAEMQARGIAEADASLDVDGWDAAAKTAALANVLLGAGITPHTVDRQGITPAAGPRAVEARAAGRRLKLVARARREGGRVTAQVGPAELPSDDLLAGLEGQQNAIILETDLLEEIAVVQRGGSLTQTAYALLSDLVTIARAMPQSPRSARGRRSL
jgi:homoserine dehydrogenase